MRTFRSVLLSLLVPLALIAVMRTAGAGDTTDIRGTVKYAAKPPERRALVMTGAAECAKTQQLDEVVVVNANRTLRDVHVRIQSGTAGVHEAPKAAVVINQQQCVYRPRVVGAMKGQSVRVTNDDALMHNVHGYRGKRTAFNRPQTAGAPAIDYNKLGKPGEVFALKCDVHSWMSAFVPITDHPYFDVTGEDGSFRLRNVPAGKTFTIEAWHPEYGLKTAQARAGDSISFSYP